MSDPAVDYVMIINKTQFTRVFQRKKKCSNYRVERLTQGLRGSALYYFGLSSLPMAPFSFENWFKWFRFRSRFL